VEVQILVDGKPAVTTKQAAAKRGITPAGMRAVLNQHGVEPVTYLDDRTPLYDADVLDRLPPAGRGVHRRRRAA
jgi:hypothetical protein